MWHFARDYLHTKRQLKRATAEQHLASLKRQVIQVRTDLADLHEEVAFALEDLDGLVRRITRVQEQVLERQVAEPELTPRMFDGQAWQR